MCVSTKEIVWCVSQVKQSKSDSPDNIIILALVQMDSVGERNLTSTHNPEETLILYEEKSPRLLKSLTSVSPSWKVTILSFDGQLNRDLQHQSRPSQLS